LILATLLFRLKENNDANELIDDALSNIDGIFRIHTAQSQGSIAHADLLLLKAKLQVSFGLFEMAMDTLNASKSIWTNLNLRNNCSNEEIKSRMKEICFELANTAEFHFKDFQKASGYYNESIQFSDDDIKVKSN
jgi:tetratricopeptide (TPR) repeat protein